MSPRLTLLPQETSRMPDWFWILALGYVLGILTFGVVLLCVGWGIRRGKWIAAGDKP